jgi:phosphate transport system permease protein
MTPTQSPFATTGRSRHGEPWVWLTAAGLTVGVIMAISLVLLILIKGTWSFWPRRIDLMEVSRNGQVEKIAGYVTQESERRDAQGQLHEEIQVFRGNKDINGEAFKFIDRQEILQTTRPDSLLLVERLEYGPAIVHGVALEVPGKRMDFSDPAFETTLRETLAAGAKTRKQLLRIERKQIGAISRELEALGRAE